MTTARTAGRPTRSSTTVPPVVRLLAVAIGGALGTLARAGVAVATEVASWPLHTLVVNLAGAFLLGALLPWIGHDRPWAVGVRVGLLGSFTTFSALVVDVVALRDRPGVALGYLGASLVGGLVLAAWGLRAGRRLRGRSGGRSGGGSAT